MKIKKVPTKKLSKIEVSKVYVDKRNNTPYLCVASSNGFGLYFIDLETSRFRDTPDHIDFEYYSEVEALLTINL